MTEGHIPVVLSDTENLPEWWSGPLTTGGGRRTSRGRAAVVEVGVVQGMRGGVAAHIA